MEKVCFKCNEEKPLTEFYKHKMMADGHLNKCIDCAKNDEHIRRAENIDEIRAYDRNRPNSLERSRKFGLAEKERLKDPDYREKSNARKKKWAESNIIRKSAHIITGNAIRDNRLIRKLCEVCGESKAEAHHEDYEKPLEVNWLCKKHHMERHKELNEIKRNG